MNLLKSSNCHLSFEIKFDAVFNLISNDQLHFYKRRLKCQKYAKTREWGKNNDS